MFTLKTYDKLSIELTSEEGEAVLARMVDGDEMVIVQGSMIKTSNISGIYNNANEPRGDQKVGYLHDGTRVIKQFGRWVCDDGHMDEEGLLLTTPSREYYPEVAVDLVATVDEWHTLGSEFYEQNKERINRIRCGEGKMEAIGSLLDKYKPKELNA